MSFLDPLHPQDVSVVTSDLLVATPDRKDPLVDDSVQQALQTLRAMLRVNAVFVAEVVDRRKVARAMVRDEVFKVAIGDAVPLEDTYCKLVLEGRLPEYIPDVERLAETLPVDLLPVAPNPAGIRAHVSTPITLPDGRVYGTLCCISDGPLRGDEEKSLMQLRQCAKFVANAIARAPADAERG